jgi:hypothetical protein
VITANIGKYAGISHEVMVNFKFGGKKTQEINEDSVKMAEEQRLAKEAAYEQKIDSLQQVLEQNRDRIRDLNKQLGAQAQQQQQTQSQVQSLEEKIKNIQDQVNNAPAYPPGGGQAVNNNEPRSHNNTAAQKQNPPQQNENTSNTKTNENKTSEPASNKNSAVNQTNDAVNQTNSAPTRNSALEMLDSKVLESDVWIASYPSSEYINEKDQHPQASYYIIVGTFFYRDFAEAEAERFRKKGYKGCNWIYSEMTKHNYIFTHKIASRQEAISKVKEMQQTVVKDAWILQLK